METKAFLWNTIESAKFTRKGRDICLEFIIKASHTPNGWFRSRERICGWANRTHGDGIVRRLREYFPQAVIDEVHTLSSESPETNQAK